jgi:NAD(P)-dependent dehydrogenase (short-subunit alcohol dehydrogenase family)
LSKALESFDLTGKVSLVTGATKGLGRAMVQGLAEAGSDVVVVSRKAELCDEVAKQVEQSTGRHALSAACHMGDWDALGELVDKVYAQFGRLDVLINNAAINPAPTLVTEITSEYFDKLMGVNVKGPVRLAGLVAPRMGEAGGGSMINVISVGAYISGPSVSVYTAGKAALMNFSRAMAAEWAGINVRVNALAPGPFMTEMMRGTAKFDDQFITRSAQATLMNRIAEPEEIVPLVLYLASDASSYVTGEDFAIAGGMRTN